MGNSSDRVSSESDLAIEDAFDPPMGRARPPQYIDLDIIRNADDLMAIISQRRSSGVITFAIFKEFDRDRRRERTSFVAQSLAESYRDILDITIRRMAEIQSSPEILESLLKKAGVSPVVQDRRGRR